MSIRVKTVEYVLPSFTGTIGSGANFTLAPLYEFPAITCSFPESGSTRNFRSVMAEFTWNGYWAAATNLSGVIFGISSRKCFCELCNKNISDHHQMVVLQFKLILVILSLFLGLLISRMKLQIQDLEQRR